ncbi:hypothetical protein LCGC14_1971640 [marine sediment metagenome]|uniref:Uncharacterized protein n=1 Tax=marine sediment metagenome TaxID=412755 RepID=A0A0F9I8N5_9ZZZZ
MTQKFVIKGNLPDFNQLINDSKKHWSVYSKQKEKLTWDIALIIKSQKLKPVKKYPIKIRFIWHCKNRMKDPDNICAAKKFCIDSLKEAQIIIDDGFKYIAGFTDEFYIDKNNPRIEVFIEE